MTSPESEALAAAVEEPRGEVTAIRGHSDRQRQDEPTGPLL